MAAKGVYVSLRSGVDRATLPDNRSMKPNALYLISVDDFQKLSRSVRETVIQVSGIETKSSVVSYGSGTGDLFRDLASWSGGNAEDIASEGWTAGKVLQGLNGEAFKLCKVVDDDATEGDVVNWSDKAASEVTTGAGEFAGVLVGDTDEGNFGWVQTEGVVSEAKANTGVSAGANLKSDDDGKFYAATGNGDTVATALSAESGGTIEVALRSTRVRNRYVKRPNIFYPGQ